MPTHPEHVAVWFELPVTDLEKSVAFYNTVLDQDMAIDTSGPNPMAVINPASMDTGVGGHLYVGKPARDGITVHLMAPNGLKDARAKVAAAGGSIEGDDIHMPFGSFCYARDLDGNSIGLFEPKA